MTIAGNRLIASAKEASDKYSKRYFVVIPGLRGPEGQIWHDLPQTGEGKKSVKCLFGPIEVNPNETIDELMVIYRDKIDCPQN